MLKPLRQGLPPLDPSAASDAASCALPARYEAVREARRFARATLGGWDVGDRFDDICLVVSELVTNALRHALPHPDPCPVGPLGHEQLVRLQLMRWTGRLVCAVRDPSADTPVARETEDFSAESGRGLFLVDSFSDSWGWHPLAGSLPGKVVWAMFGLGEERGELDRGEKDRGGVDRGGVDRGGVDRGGVDRGGEIGGGERGGLIPGEDARGMEGVQGVEGVRVRGEARLRGGLRPGDGC